MRNKSLTIKVCGLAGTGKTLIAKYLEQFLIEKGVDVGVTFDECDGFCDWDGELCEETLEGMIDDGLEVMIETVQIRKELNTQI